MMKKLIAGLMVVLFSTFSFAAPAIQESRSAERALLRGRVTDAKTGEPIAKVKVIVIGSNRSATTDGKGEFVFHDLAAGEVGLYITTVGYGLVKKRVMLREGDQNEVSISLQSEGAARLDEVTVTAGPFEQTETNSGPGTSLNKQELQALSLVLVADPIRAAQGLPGVVGNDDFNSQFSLRGAGFRRIGFAIDGLFLPDNPTHTVYGDFNAGQIAIVNADTVAAVSLYSGTFPSKYGDGTAGLINIETRDGNRIKPSGRIAASLLSSSATFDGPMPGKRGAWLVTARKSYFQYLIDALINDEETRDQVKGFAVDFTDAQIKTVYDLTAKHQVGFNAITGFTDFDPDRTNRTFDIDEIARSRSKTSFINASWNYTAGLRFGTQTRFFGLWSDYKNSNINGSPIANGALLQSGVRSDLNFSPMPSQRIETGIYLRSSRGRGLENDLSQTPPRSNYNYEQSGSQQAFYLQDTWTMRRLSMALTGGARVEHSNLIDDTIIMPRAAFSIAPLENTRFRFGWGQHAEFPGFSELYGVRSNPNLRAERATHYNLSLEQYLNSRTRIVAEAYHREDKDLLFSYNDTVVIDNQQVPVSIPFTNLFRGYARGIELSIHRRSANRLSGWVGYAYSVARLRSPEVSFSQFGLMRTIPSYSFASDYDQRHTFSSYGNIRLTNTFNLSGQFRYGSGLPVIGFYEEVDGGDRVPSSERNAVRLPAFSRLDLRLNKAFLLRGSKLTLSGEVINVLDHDNYRQGSRRNEKLLPLLPSVGIAFEF
ncbi:MAG TPA: TonB-dependent receptor [Blastocatellia bacterium]|nr:TonB-dependent receptor [Blastocatellia bacterium]